MLKTRFFSLHILLSLFALANILPFTQGSASSSQKKGLLLCTESGYQWVQVETEGSPAKSQKKNPLIKKCPLCYFSAKKTLFLLSPPIKVVKPERISFIQIEIFQPLLKFYQQSLKNHLSPRAPPLS